MSDSTRVVLTPIDYLYFASPVSCLGGNMGIYATHKWTFVKTLEWGRTIRMPDETQRAVQAAFDAVMRAAPSV